jgi:hypothetical protein
MHHPSPDRPVSSQASRHVRCKFGRGVRGHHPLWEFGTRTDNLGDGTNGPDAASVATVSNASRNHRGTCFIAAAVEQLDTVLYLHRCEAPGLELTDIVYTSGPSDEGGTRDREGAGPHGRAPPGDHPPRPGGDRQRLADVPVLRDHPPGLLQVAPPLRGAGPGGAARPLTKAPRDPERHQARGDRQDRLPAQALPLRTSQDLDVPQALPRRPGLTLGGLEDPEAPRHEPASGLPALPAPRGSLEALREAAARSSGPDRREVHRSAARLPEEALPVHRDR